MRFVIFLCIPVSEQQLHVESVYEKSLFQLRESWHFPKGHGSLRWVTDNDQWNVMSEKGGKKTFLARLIMYARVCHAQRGM